MSNVVIADSSCLIALAKIDRLNILKLLFNLIYVSRAVYDEVVVQGKGRPGSVVVNADWIKVCSIRNSFAVNVLSDSLGLGESEAIVLTNELNADIKATETDF